MTLQPTQNFLAIRRVEASTTSPAGIQLPNPQPTHGVIFAAGPDAKHPVGTRVVLGRWPVTSVEGEDIHFIRDTDVFALLT